MNQCPQTDNSPEVSLLVPIYNAERYLEQCLRSALGQTLDDIEIIAINDGSTDDSGRILESFAERDRRLRVIEKPNSGYGASLNCGLATARGEYVAVLEADDWMEADALASLLHHARRGDAQVVRGNYWHYWSAPRERNVLQRVVPEGFIGQTIDPARHSELFSITPSIWAGLYRRDLLEENAIRFLESPGASYQDTAFAFKVWAAARRVLLLRAAFVHYRQDNEDSSVKSEAKVFCVMEEFAEVARFLREDRPDLLERLAGVLLREKLRAYLWNLDRLSPAARPQFLSVAHDDLAGDVAAGHLNESLLRPWHLCELKALLKDPIWFLTLRASRSGGPASRVRYYYELGGAPLVARVAWGALVGH
ncbi:MAG: glycosyltransferase [Coriobacteriales bacterium]|jgi:glycosyltransferase involved in cell wall biosynthesis|nr:glycosyltransferase [Coriobacteriales bacterium]